MFTGISDTIFDPDGTGTRAMAVTVTRKIFKEMNADSNTGFTDVTADKYYADYVSWGAKNGVVKGISETEFAPKVQLPVNRFRQ